MPSNINPFSIDNQYPVAGIVNDTQGFRTNFNNIRTNFTAAAAEITALQNSSLVRSNINTLGNTVLSGGEYLNMAFTRYDNQLVNGNVSLDYTKGQFQTITTNGPVIIQGINNFPSTISAVPGGNSKAGRLLVKLVVTSNAHTITWPTSTVSSTSLSYVTETNSSTGVSGFTTTGAGTYWFELISDDGGSNFNLRDLTRGVNITQVTGTFTSLNVSGIESVTGNISTSSNLNVSANANVVGNLNVFANAVIYGNLQVKGTTTSINQQNINTANAIIVLSNGAVNSSQANGSGIQIANANIASFLYSGVTQNFMTSTGIQPNSNVTASLGTTTNWFNNVYAKLSTTTLITNSQPYITTVGTLGNLAVAGNITAGYTVFTGPAGNVPNSNLIGSFVGNAATYAQINVQNLSNASTASGDIVVTAGDGSDSNYYIDLGMNSGTYNVGAYSISGANDGYLYVQGGDLALGTASYGNAIIFHTDGTVISNEAGRIAYGRWILGGSDNGIDKLQVTGSAKINGNLSVNSMTNYGIFQLNNSAFFYGNVTVTGNLSANAATVYLGNTVTQGNTYVGARLNYVPNNANLQYAGNINSFVQLVAQNLNGGANATVDIVAVANNGNDNINYIDMGMTSNGYAAAGYGLTGPNDGYLLVQGNGSAAGGNLVLSTYSNRDIIFSTGGGDFANEMGRFRYGNGFTVTGNVVLGQDITAVGNIYTTGGHLRTTAPVANIFNRTGNIYMGLQAANILLGNSSGNTTIQGNLVVTANLTANIASVGNLTIEGNNIYSSLTNVDFNIGRTSATANINMNRVSVFNKDVYKLGNSFILGAMTVTGVTSFIGNNNVLGNSNLTGNVYVSGSMNITNNVVLQSNLSVIGNSNVQGVSSTVGNLNTYGNINAYGNVNVIGNLNTIGATSTLGNTFVYGNSVNYGQSSFTGNVTITGNLLVLGNSITSSTVLQVTDRNVVLANNAPTAAAADGAGLIIGPNTAPYSSFVYNASNDTWGSPLSGLQVTGPLIVSGVTTFTGNNNVLGNSNLTGNLFSSGFSTFIANTATNSQGGLLITGNVDGSYVSPGLSGVMLHVSGQYGTPARVNIDGQNSYPSIAGRRFNGAVSAPTQVLANQDLFRIAGVGYTSSGWPSSAQGNSTARFAMVTNEAFTSSAQGTRMEWWVTPNGQTASSMANVMALDATTGLYVGANITSTGNANVQGNVILQGNLLMNSAAVSLAGIDQQGLYMGSAASPLIYLIYNYAERSFVSNTGVRANALHANNALRFGGNIIYTGTGSNITTIANEVANNIVFGANASSLAVGGANSNVSVAGNLSVSSNVYVTGQVYATGNVNANGINTTDGITASGNVAASYFQGNGSALTFNVGTWTPNLSYSGGGAATFTSAIGNYVKIGRQVTAHFTLVATSSTGATNVTLTQLPFLSQNVAGNQGALHTGQVSTSTVGVIVGNVGPNANSVALYHYTTAAFAAMTYGTVTAADLGTSFTLNGSISYISAS
jgi:hypothetical protein